MKVLKGITAATGLARGISCLYTEKIEESIPHYIIEKDRVNSEIHRLREGYNKAKDTMKEVLEVSEKMFGKAGDEIFKAHNMILDDQALYEEIVKLIRGKLVNAEHAVSDAFNKYLEKLKGEQFHFAELTHDIMDVRNRLISAFSGISGHFECPVGKRQAVIVASKRLTPSMVLNIPREHVLAFITEEGGFTTHATILARNYGVPVIFGVDVENNINCADKVIVDGFSGKVIVNPDSATGRYYSDKIEKTSQKKAYCKIKVEEPPQTKESARITLKANISTLGEVELLKDLNYDGIGLLRSEFLFVNKDKPPSEEEWRLVYRKVLEGVNGRPVVVRLLDIGQDKLPGYLHLPQQENPDLGIRGARAVDFFYDIYLSQIKAILQCSVYGDLQILYPMVSDVSDIESYRKILKEAKSALRKEKIKFKNNIKEGIMIETPAAAVMADRLLRNVDFANIGSNDLIQYTLAASRGNQLIEKRYHILHPSLVRLMEFIVKAGKKHKKEICLCGEIAGFEDFYPLFLNIGLESFSVAAARLEDIKCNLMHTEKKKKNYVKRFYDMTTKKDIDKFFEKRGQRPF